MSAPALEKLDEFRWRIPKTGAMRVPGLVFASEKLAKKLREDKSLEQVANVAHLPGIVLYSLAMPDIHWGYGFPIGGVAATEIPDGAISPGGVGYDISCGVRLLRTNLKVEEIRPKLKELVDQLYRDIPTGVGARAELSLSREELRQAVLGGAAWAVRRGFGTEEDLERLENGGALSDADPEAVSERAWQRGLGQMGTLGSGNHFLEVQEVAEIYDGEIARAWGLFPGALAVSFHCGSRGFGYQVCEDALGWMEKAAAKYGFGLPDRQLASVPFSSPEGQRYYGGMCAAANYARANRQMITHRARLAFQKALKISAENLGMEIIYDVAHNLASVEEHEWDGKKRKLLVHRKGATRCFGPGHPALPPRYQKTGQPVLVPGSMGTASFVLAGLSSAHRESFGSTCHGAGRAMSRGEALRKTRGDELQKELLGRGIFVRAPSLRGLAEEAPSAYKDVSEIVEVCEGAGLSRKIARLVPVGVIKG